LINGLLARLDVAVVAGILKFIPAFSIYTMLCFYRQQRRQRRVHRQQCGNIRQRKMAAFIILKCGKT